MLNDINIKIIYYDHKASNLFPDAAFTGGIVIIYRDAEEEFGKTGVFTPFKELNTILTKVSSRESESIIDLMTGRGVYRLTAVAINEFPKIVDLQSRGHSRDIGTSAFRLLNDVVLFESKPTDTRDYVLILGLAGSNRSYRWIRSDFISTPYGFDKYKVAIPKANGSGAVGEVVPTPLIGEPLVLGPLEGFTETFISIGAFDTEEEAQNCLNYVKTKFARIMLGVLKVTQDNPRDKWSKVPLQDFTPESDIDWTQTIAEIDRQLYAKYGLDETEIAFIEEKIRAME
jgi:hypothetical protein